LPPNDYGVIEITLGDPALLIDVVVKDAMEKVASCLGGKTEEILTCDINDDSLCTLDWPSFALFDPLLTTLEIL